MTDLDVSTRSASGALRFCSAGLAATGIRHIMRFEWAILAIVMLAPLLFHCTDAQAQIYTCRAPDGTRIFSDERCGPDAKIVPGIESGKRPAAQGTTAPRAPAPPKQPADLDALLQQCDRGIVAACNEWTRSGGPSHLREKERQAQQSCDAGSLAACEERYCADGASVQCRTRVMKTAKLTGTTWYLRSETRQADDARRYDVRCIWEGVRDTRDVAVFCAATAGPQRCSDAARARFFPRLDAAAASYCAQR
jgi:hypothetical protein